MNEQEIRNLLREMRDEPVPVDSLVRVRLKLDERIRRRARWRIGAWSTAFASVLLAGVFAWQGMQVREMVQSRPEPLPIVRSEKSRPEELAVRPAIWRTPHRIVRKPQSLVIRMETADPDVVILLVSE